MNPRAETLPAVAKRLREAVTAIGSNKRVSELSGVQLRTLSEYLRGSEMKFSTLQALADACGVRLAWLATGELPIRRGDNRPPAECAVISESCTPPAAAAIDLVDLAHAVRIFEALTAGHKPPLSLEDRALRIAEAYRLLSETRGKAESPSKSPGLRGS